MNTTAQQRGAAMCRLRETKGLTQQQLGDLIGVNQSTVARYESGKYKLTVDMALKIISALDCSLGDLLGAMDA